MIQRVLAIWSLVPLPFLKPAWERLYRRGSDSNMKLQDSQTKELVVVIRRNRRWRKVTHRWEHSLPKSPGASWVVCQLSGTPAVSGTDVTQHARPPCPSPTPRVHPDSRPLSQWCHPLISHTSKAVLKILQARLQQYLKHELPDVQAGFRKGRETRDQLANIHWIIKKAREFQKNIYFCFTDYAKAFYCVDHINSTKFWMSWEYQTTWFDSWEICIQVRKQQLELDMEQQTGSK